MKKLTLLKVIIAAIFCSSCTTYLVTTDSLTTQLAQVDSAALTPVTVRGPLGEKYNYLANPIDIIKVTDKKGNEAELVNKPSIEIRLTETSGKKTIFYFDRIIIEDNKLYGVQSRFMSAMSKSIPLDQIAKIEIQDGKKNFNYVTK
ncbi:hypothetical protein GCM10011506_05190 [Marivirga lumbricoides]|uniref:Lipoprotein n=1 Tax=Marivirga lumbricoides TaxID=1046115 RepID=A0ABQ1LHL2_9BACT|nr:hypothetical protein GCM10011506_05190 [Marivirga lumbricoides]